MSRFDLVAMKSGNMTRIVSRFGLYNVTCFTIVVIVKCEMLWFKCCQLIVFESYAIKLP